MTGTERIAVENREFQDNYDVWLGKTQDAMVRQRGAAPDLMAKLVPAMESLTPPTVAMKDLLIGDVLLVTPEEPVGFLIDVLTGMRGASHALVYLGRTPNGALFLDHTALDPLRPERRGGTHIISDVEFRQQYGERSLQAARTLTPVDGRRLLRQALDLAGRDARPGGWRTFRPTTFSLIGTTEDNAACSVRSAMVVFKATGLSDADIDARLKSLKIFDVSPNSFADSERLGKYFVTFPVQR